GQSQRQLSAQLGIHRNVMVTVVDRLEEQGLVKRMPHPGDRRAFAVTLTDKARKLLPELDAVGRAQEDEITA
ncbi:MarR family transcriptional regulator, partial [Mycolicibacterium elephantis]